MKSYCNKTVNNIINISSYLRWMIQSSFCPGGNYITALAFKINVTGSQIFASPRMSGVWIVWIQKVCHFSLSTHYCKIKTLLLNYLLSHWAVSWEIPTTIIFPWGKARLKFSWKLCAHLNTFKGYTLRDYIESCCYSTEEIE